MKMGRQLFVLVMALLIASPLMAQEPKKAAAKKTPPCPAAQRIEQWTKGLSLTDEQKAKLDPVKKEFGPKLMDLMKKREAIFTAEQKQARGEALKAAAKEGKKGHDFYAAGEAAVTLSEEQKPKVAEVKKEIGQVEKDFSCAALMDVLTPEQQEQVKKAAKKHAK